IGTAYNVYNTLGHGLLARRYESALAPELRRAGVEVEQQHPAPVRC
ncbi:MAG: GxxExxY protein, partial [Candidatus Brocadiae bacterium]|nr:GxxExxY protein [Candidatus Brocadiia bacterium]